MAEEPPPLAARTRLGGELAWASLLHVWNDGLTAALTVLLPFVAADLHLGYAQAALLRTAHLTALTVTQIPLTALSGAVGETGILGGGLVWFGAAYLALGLALTFGAALVWVTVAGAGAGAYHPVATNRIARLAEPRRRGRAVGTLNFSGDIGKVALVAAAGGLATVAGWRQSLGSLGGLGVLVGSAYLWTHRRRPQTPSAPDPRAAGPESPRRPDTWWGIHRPWPFAVLSLIGGIDGAVRSAMLTFLPFLLVARGFGKAEVGGLFALLVIGGAAGKYVCGWLTDLLGQRLVIVATEIVMAAGAVGVLWVRGGAAFAVYLVALGVVLNGTSSVIYTGIAAFVDQSRGSRGYGLFYTGAFSGSALAPAAFGALADRGGLPAVFWGLGLVTLLIPVFAAVLPHEDRGREERVADTPGS